MAPKTVTAGYKFPCTSENRPFPSYPSPLFQNRSTCEAIHMKMCSTFQLGNGLLKEIKFCSFDYRLVDSKYLPTSLVTATVSGEQTGVSRK